MNKATPWQAAFITPGQGIIAKTKEQFNFSYYYETAVDFKTKLLDYLLGKSMQHFFFSGISHMFSHFADIKSFFQD